MYVLTVTTATFLRVPQTRRRKEIVTVRLLFRRAGDDWKGLYEPGEDRCSVRIPAEDVWPEIGVDSRLSLRSFPSYCYFDAWEYLVGTLAHEFTHSLGLPGSLPGEVNCECTSVAALLYFRLHRNEINKLIIRQERFFNEILSEN